MMNVSLARRHSDTWAAALRFVRHRYDQAFEADADHDPYTGVIALNAIAPLFADPLADTSSPTSRWPCPSMLPSLRRRR
jgi:hypothetical protein